MENEVLELRKEIEILTKRIEILEGKENKRKAFVYTKMLVRIILILLIIYGVWTGYQYLVNEIPKIMEDKINEINTKKVFINDIY